MGGIKDPKKKQQWKDNLSKALKGKLKSEAHRRKISENWKPFPSRGKKYGRAISDGKKKKGGLFYEGYSADRVRWMRGECINYGGGCCRVCKNIKSLVFHHWKDKCFGIGDELGCNRYTLEEFKKEIDKCILVCRSCHNKIHVRSYNYLVEKKLVEDYIEWFKRNYKVEKGSIKHHIDLNPKNNSKENLLFLTRAMHRKLHNDGYPYLIEIEEIDNYIEWFCVKGVKCENTYV